MTDAAESRVAASRAPSVRRSVALVIGIGLAVTAIAFTMLRRTEELRVVRTLELRVRWRAADLEAKIKLAGQAVVATATDVATEPRVESEEFHQFTSAVAAPDRAIASIAWAQRVSGPQRTAFEAAGIRIVDRAADGSLVPAVERDVYTPIALQ